MFRPERKRQGVVGEDKGMGAADGILDPDETEFLAAIEEYKKMNRVRFPTWSEALWVAKRLGYKKTEGIR